MKINFKDKKIAVLGFGLEGRDVVKFLLSKKANITIFDQKAENELDFKGIDKRKIKLVCGRDYLKTGLDDFDIVFRSPGFYRYLAELERAEKKGVKISSAIKLFFHLCPAKIIGVTGTKGKGTTSTLIYKILKKSGKDAYLAGNIGKPYLELLAKLKKSSWVVLELSSFQLIDLDKSPHIALVLNITTDHLDWHKDRKEYLLAKRQIVRHQNRGDFAVLNVDYKDSRGFAQYTKAKVCLFSKFKKGKIVLTLNKKDYFLGNADKLLLRGKHNWENVSAALCTAALVGADLEAMKTTIFSFKALEHRLELVGKVKGVAFYNDSFATGPQPTMAAINSFSQPITLILGGSDKGLDYGELVKEIKNKKNLKTVILIGEIAREIKKLLLKIGFQGRILALGKGSMAEIVKTSFSQTAKGGVVLLSPASASFDMFENYKDRGNQFKQAVRMLLV